MKCNLHDLYYVTHLLQISHSYPSNETAARYFEAGFSKLGSLQREPDVLATKIVLHEVIGSAAAFNSTLHVFNILLSQKITNCN